MIREGENNEEKQCEVDGEWKRKPKDYRQQIVVDEEQEDKNDLEGRSQYENREWQGEKMIKKEKKSGGGVD